MRWVPAYFNAPIYPADRRFETQLRQKVIPLSHSPFDPSQENVDFDEVTSPEDVQEEEEETRVEAVPEWLELFFDLAWTITFSGLSANTPIKGPMTVVSYLLFFALTWWLWIAQVLYDTKFYVNDWWHRIFLLLQFILFGTLSAFTDGFDVTIGIKADDPSDSDAGDAAEETYVKRAFLAIAMVFFVSRLLLAIEYFRVTQYAKQRRLAHLYILISTLCASATLFLISFLVTRAHPDSKGANALKLQCLVDFFERGSPLSPVLYLFYAADLLEIAEPAARNIFARQLVSGFVDDTAIVVSSKEGAERNIALLRPLVHRAFGWSDTHACKFDVAKFHMVHHTRNKRRRVDAELRLGEIVIKPEKSARYLGVIMDAELRWHAHVDNVVAKATAATLAIGRLASGRFGLPYRFIRTLYISVVRPKIEYALPLWYTPVQSVEGSTRRRGSVGFANRLSRVQRIAARLITGAFKTAPTDALEYHANLMPMDLRLNIAAFNATVRLATLPDHHPLREQVDKCQSRAPLYFKSPVHKLFIAYPHLCDVEIIDSTPRPTTWTPSFGKRIASSREEAAAEVRALEESSTFVIYSDGSGEGNVVGASAVAAHPLGGVLVHRARLGHLSMHTVFEGELFGIVLALRIVADLPDVVDAAICLDNQSAIVRAHKPRAKSGQILTSAIHAAVERIRAIRPEFRLRLVWVPGHDDVDGNELADLHAKKASAGEDTDDALLDDEPLPDSAAALRAAFKKDASRRWQARWAESERGLRYARFDTTPPSARVARMYRGLKRGQAALLTQLRTGHVALNQYLHRIGAVDSPACVRCGEPETVDHFLLRCPRYLAPRQTLRGQLKGRLALPAAARSSSQSQ